MGMCYSRKLLAAITDINRDLTSINEKVDQCATKIDLDTLRSTVQATKSDLDTLRSTVQAIQEKVDKLNSTVDATQADVEAIQNKVDDLNSTVDKLNSTVDKMKLDSDNMKRINGNMYDPLDDLWEAKKEAYAGFSKKLKEYREDKGKAPKEYDVPFRDPIVSGHEMTESKKKDFPPMFPGSGISFAHLLPNSILCAFTWVTIIQAITGKCDRGSTIEFMLGSSEAVFPLRDWDWNQLRLPHDHNNYFDKLSKTKAVIIVPIWDPNTQWENKRPYDLLVVATPSAYVWLMGQRKWDEKAFPWLQEASKKDIEQGTKFLQLMVKALADQLETFQELENELDNKGDARTRLLAAAAAAKTKHEAKRKAEEEAKSEADQGNAQPTNQNVQQNDLATQGSQTGSKSSTGTTSGSKRKSQEPESIIKGALEKVKNLVKRKGKDVESEILVPSIREGYTFDRHVLKVDLGSCFKGKLELVPDPFLVAIKAAVNWSAYNGQNLLEGFMVMEDVDFIEGLEIKPTDTSIDDVSTDLSEDVDPAVVSSDESSERSEPVELKGVDPMDK